MNIPLKTSLRSDYDSVKDVVPVSTILSSHQRTLTKPRAKKPEFFLHETCGERSIYLVYASLCLGTSPTTPTFAAHVLSFRSDHGILANPASNAAIFFHISDRCTRRQSRVARSVPEPPASMLSPCWSRCLRRNLAAS